MPRRIKYPLIITVLLAVTVLAGCGKRQTSALKTASVKDLSEPTTQASETAQAATKTAVPAPTCTPRVYPSPTPDARTLGIVTVTEVDCFGNIWATLLVQKQLEVVLPVLVMEDAEGAPTGIQEISRQLVGGVITVFLVYPSDIESLEVTFSAWGNVQTFSGTFPGP